MISIPDFFMYSTISGSNTPETVNLSISSISYPFNVSKSFHFVMALNLKSGFFKIIKVLKLLTSTHSFPYIFRITIFDGISLTSKSLIKLLVRFSEHISFRCFKFSIFVIRLLLNAIYSNLKQRSNPSILLI